MHPSFDCFVLGEGHRTLPSSPPLPTPLALASLLPKSGDVYILDAGVELFVWVGRGSSVEEKKNGIPYAINFIKENGRDVSMPVSRLSHGYENLNFKG